MKAAHQKLLWVLVAVVRHADAGTTSSYARPSRARDLRAHEVGCSYTNTAPTTPGDDLFRGFACDSQAHVTFASPTSAILSYVTPEAVATELRYKRRDQRLWRTAFGDARSYTALAGTRSCAIFSLSLAWRPWRSSEEIVLRTRGRRLQRTLSFRTRRTLRRPRSSHN